MKKATGAKFRVKINAKSANDLASGRFQSLNIEGNNLNIDGIYLSHFYQTTVCDFNYIKVSKKDLVFKEDFVMKFMMDMTSSDLQKTMDASGYLKSLNKVDISGCGVSLLKIKDANILIKNNKLYFVMDISAPFLFSQKSIKISVGTDFKVEDGKIVFTKLYLDNLYSRIDLSELMYALNMINPMDFSMNIYKEKNAKIQIKNAKIENNIFKVDGLVVIPKDTISKVNK